MTAERLNISDTYERRAWREYLEWVEHGRELGFTGQLAKTAGSKALEVGSNAWDRVKTTRGGHMLQQVGESAQQVWESEQVQQLYEATMKGVMGAYEAAVDASLQTVNPNKVVKHYDGHLAGGRFDELRGLPLSVLDSERPAVHGRYRVQLTASSGATGTAQGLTSVTGVVAAGVIVADVVATIGLSARGIATHLAHYGYDVTGHTEHAYVLTLMQTSMAETAVERSLLTQQARSLAVNLAKDKTWAELNENLLTQIARRAFQSVSERMTKKRLARFLPGLAGVIGAGQGYTHGRMVMDAAYYEGRARLLRDRWGGDDVEVIELEADDIE